MLSVLLVKWTDHSKPECLGDQAQGMSQTDDSTSAGIADVATTHLHCLATALPIRLPRLPSKTALLPSRFQFAVVRKILYS